MRIIRNKKKLIAQVLLLGRKRTSNEYWVHPVNKMRNKIGDQVKLDLKHRKYPERFLKETRFTPEQFDTLLNLLKSKLQKCTNRRGSISPQVRLYVVLRYLGHGASMQQLSDSFCIGKSTICTIINETTRVIWEMLSATFMPVLEPEDWLRISKEFEIEWNFPHCIGALDGKHVQIQCPRSSGSLYFNYKKTFSMNLMAMCDAKYRFTMIDVGQYGRKNDGGVFKDCPFGQILMNDEMDLPSPDFMPNSTLVFPYTIVADDAFPLVEYIMKPFPGSSLKAVHRIFNYRLSRARRTIENTFGILATRFRIFRTSIIGKPENIDFTIKAACVLHNFLRTWDIEHGTTFYFGQDMLDREDPNDFSLTRGLWRKKSTALKPLKRIGSNNYSRNAKLLRDNLATYFVTKNTVAWQNKHVKTTDWNPVQEEEAE